MSDHTTWTEYQALETISGVLTTLLHHEEQIIGARLRADVYESQLWVQDRLNALSAREAKRQEAIDGIRQSLTVLVCNDSRDSVPVVAQALADLMNRVIHIDWGGLTWDHWAIGECTEGYGDFFWPSEEQ